MNAGIGQNRIPTFVCAIIAAILLFPRPALAYLDPGTGSVVLQILLAGLAGVAVVWKLAWARIKAFFCRCNKSNETLVGDKKKNQTTMSRPDGSSDDGK